MIVALTIEAAQRVARAMRSEDLREIIAAEGPAWEPDGWAQRLVDLPGVAFAVVDRRGDAVAMGGLACDGAGRASAWFVATPRLREPWARVDAHRFALRLRREAIARALHRVTVMGIAGRPNVDRWLRRLGFRDEGEHPGMGAAGETFRSYGWLPGRATATPEMAHADRG